MERRINSQKSNTSVKRIKSMIDVVYMGIIKYRFIDSHKIVNKHKRYYSVPSKIFVFCLLRDKISL